MTNPFAQSEQYWKVVFDVPHTAAGTAEESFGDIALAVSGFETDEANGIWTFDILFAEEPDMEEFARRLMIISALHEIEMPEATLSKVEQEDWLAKVAKDFPPIHVGRFYVHGSHVTDAPPPGSLPIRVEAGAAFGSGEHGTTYGCLEAMCFLDKKRQFKSVLDMGCGSGILAIAAAKLWRCNTLAADIDPVAVRVAAENVEINQVVQYVDAVVSDGYDSERVKRGGPYELIIANILARPLVEFAPDLAKHLKPGGAAILSGLLVDQETMVRSAHTMQGLTLVKRFVHNEWCTLLLKK